MKVSLGSGKRNFGDGWLHVDKDFYPHINYSDISLGGFESNTFDLIYASHLIAYFDREQIKSLFSMWFIKLKKGGILRLSTPNFLEIANLYARTSLPLDSVLGPLYGKMKMDGRIIYHKTVWDLLALTKALEETGFKTVRHWNWRTVEHGHIDDHSQAYIPHMDKENGTLISLNLEAVK